MSDNPSQHATEPIVYTGYEGQKEADKTIRNLNGVDPVTPTAFEAALEQFWKDHPYKIWSIRTEVLLISPAAAGLTANKHVGEDDRVYYVKATVYHLWTIDVSPSLVVTAHSETAYVINDERAMIELEQEAILRAIRLLPKVEPPKQ